MFGATIKGMLAHKVRLFLTAASIALGVAFLAGTLMLNDSMQRAFDDVFGSVNSGTDVAVRAQAGKVETDDPDDSRPPIPARTGRSGPRRGRSRPTPPTTAVRRSRHGPWAWSREWTGWLRPRAVSGA